MRDTCTSIADKVIFVFFFLTQKFRIYDPSALWEKIIIKGTKMIVAHARVE